MPGVVHVPHPYHGIDRGQDSAERALAVLEEIVELEGPNTIAAFIIDRKFDWAALFAGAGAVLSFFGFIHGTSLGIGSSIPVAAGYLVVAGFCFVLGRQHYPETVVPMGHAVAED